MITIGFPVENPKELRIIARIIDDLSKKLDNDQDYFNEMVRFLKDDYQVIFSFQYGELDECSITKKGY